MHDYKSIWLQVLPLKGMTHAAVSTMADGSIVLASGSDGGIRKLSPVPFRQQAESLADAEEFQEALQLASYIPASEACIGRPKQNVLYKDCNL